MITHWRYLLMLVSGLILGACGGMPRQPTEPHTLVLLQPVDVAEGHARAFIQAGRVVARIDEFTSHCALEITHLAGPPRTILPAHYPIKRVDLAFTPVVFAAPPRRLARWPGGDEPSDIFAGYHFWLVDALGLGLRRMSCYGRRDIPGRVRPPTPEELDQVLGRMGRLER